MKIRPLRTAFTLAACGFAANCASAAPGDIVILNSKTVILADLAPTPDAPAGAIGTAKIKVNQINNQHNAFVRLTVGGLAAGHYKLAATLTDASVTTFGSFRVAAKGKPVEPGKDDGTIVLRIPGAIAATKITDLAVIDANAVPILEGNTTVDSTVVNFTANVSITGPNTSPFPRGLGVHGHATAFSKVVDGFEARRVFLWLAFGVPGSTQFTINVDGTPVGTVTSTPQGKVQFIGLDSSVDLAAMKVITLTDSTNAVVLQAQFGSGFIQR